MGALTRLRPIEDICSQLNAANPIAVISCNNCVKISGAGGEGVWEKVCADLKARGFRLEKEVLICNPCSRGYLEDLEIPSSVRTVVMLACRGARAGLLSLRPDLEVVEGTETLGLFIASKADRAVKLAMACPGYEELRGTDFVFGNSLERHAEVKLQMPKEARP